MTVEEMRYKIEEKCMGTSDCYKEECPLLEKNCQCFGEDLTDKEIKENYELMFGKEESEMKNEFDFNELKAGYAIKVPAYEDELLIGIPRNEQLTFYTEEMDNVVKRKDIVIGNSLEEYTPVAVYGLSETDELFDSDTRPLLWERKEDMNFKKYKIGGLKIKPNYDRNYSFNENNGYKTEQEDFLFIENMNVGDCITINKSELDDVIDALTEIRDFIKKEE